MLSVLLDVHADHIDELTLILRAEGISYSVIESREFTSEAAFVVKVTGSDRQIREAESLLRKLDEQSFSCKVTTKKLAGVFRLARKNDLQVSLSPVRLLGIGRPILHKMTVSGESKLVEDFKKSHKTVSV